MKLFLSLLPLVVLGLPVAQAEPAGVGQTLYYLPLEELVRVQVPLQADVGTRDGAHTALHAIVPTDVYTAEQLLSVGEMGLAYALAASLLLTAGLAAWVAVLKSELDLSRRPQVNFTVVNLEPDGASRGDPREATVASASERIVVILNPPSFPAAVEHRVEILTDDDRVLWSGRGLRPTAAGNFHLELSRRFLPPGEYRLRLSAGDELVTHFDLWIVP